MTQTIRCKHCGKEIEITEALLHQVKEQVSRESKAEHQKDVENARKEGERDALEKNRIDKENQEKELLESKENSEKLRKQILELMEEMRSLRRKDEEREIESKKTQIKIEEETRLKTKEELEKSYHLKDLEKEKKLQDALKVNEELRKKLEQGSQQLQGEVLELDLEQELQKAFVYDEIIAVAKGERGGDILQKVKAQNGDISGSILWETKRAKWSPSWLIKLHEDKRKAGASVSILVCETLPEKIQNFGFIDDVVITNYSCALALARILRRSILQVSSAKSTAQNKDQKLERLYFYIQSDAFRHRFEAYLEGVVSLKRDLEAEKRSTQKMWKKREIQLQKIEENLTNMHAELEGYSGTSLPEIKLLNTPSEDES